jgi:hypothetical protein
MNLASGTCCGEGWMHASFAPNQIARTRSFGALVSEVFAMHCRDRDCYLGVGVICWMLSAISWHVLAQTLGCPNPCYIQKIHGSRRPISWRSHLLTKLFMLLILIDHDHIRVRRCPNALRSGSHPPCVMESPNNMKTS